MRTAGRQSRVRLRVRTARHGTRESLGALVIALAVPFLFVEEGRFSTYSLDVGSTTVDLGPSDAAVVAILLAAVIAGIRADAARLNAARILWVPGIALILWLAFETFRPVSIDDARFDDHLADYVEFVAYALLAIAVPLLVRRAQDLTLVVASFVLWSLVASAVAFAQFFGVDVFDAWPPGWRQPSFLGHSDLAALSGIAIGVAVAGILCTRRRIPAPMLFPVALGAGAVGLVLAGSLAAVMGFAVGVLLITFAAHSRFAPSGRRLLGVVALLAVVLVGVSAIRADALEPVGELTGLGEDRPVPDVQTYSESSALAYIGWRVFQDNPILGVGWQRSGRADVFEQYLADARARFPDEAEALPSAEQERGVQSLYVQMLADAGVIGLALLLAVGLGGLVLGWRTAAYASSPWAAGAGLAVICALLTVMGEWAVVGIVPGIPIDAATCLLLGLAAAGAATVEEETGG
jgi:O-Antigen ligase